MKKKVFIRKSLIALGIGSLCQAVIAADDFRKRLKRVPTALAFLCPSQVAPLTMLRSKPHLYTFCATLLVGCPKKLLLRFFLGCGAMCPALETD